MKNKCLLRISKLILVLLIGIFTTAFLNGCEEDNPLIPVSPTAKLQITNASPNSPGFDVYLNNSIIVSNFAYLNSIPYRNVTGNTVITVTMYPPGDTVSVIDTAIFCQTDKSYSFFAFDSLSKIKPLILTDDLTSPGSVNSSVRFIHLSPNAPTVDVGGVGKPQPWFPFYSFPQFSSFRPITGSIYTVYANLAGTATTLVSLPNVDLTAGRINTIILRGFDGATGTQALGLTVINNN